MRRAPKSSSGNRSEAGISFEVERSQLLSQLDEGESKRLSLILGPSGSGKSVLLRQWVRRQPAEAVVWPVVDVESSDAESFGRELVRRIAELHPGFGDDAIRHLERSGDRLGRPFLEALLEGLAGLGALTIVIDDLQELPEALSEELGWLLMRSQPELRMVVASRNEPSIRLARLRAHGQLTEIRAAALALDDGEAGKLAEHVAGRKLTPAQRQTLRERTEGWAVGVQLAALALRDKPDVDDYLATFSGANREVADYLVDEVVGHQPAELRSFLWATSVLDRLDPDLCNDLTGRDDSQQVITELQRRELFVVPLGAPSGCCRYHHLFAEVMRHQLRAQDRSLHDDLLARAARWHLERDELALAVEYLLRASLWQEALDLVGANGWALYERGETALAIRWLESVPTGQMRRHGQAEFTLVTLYRFAGQASSATALLNELERSRPPESRGAMAIAVLRATGVRQDVLPEDALAGAQKAVAWFASDEHAPKLLAGEPSDRWILACTRVYGAVALVNLGRFAEAREWLSLGLKLSGPFRPWKVRALGCLAVVEVEEGNLEEAYGLIQQALRLDEEAKGIDPASTMDAQIALAMLAYERNDLEVATAALNEAENLARASNSTNTLAGIVAWRARLALARGEPRLGLEVIGRWRREGAPSAPPGAQADVVAVEAHLLLAMREVTRAKRVLAKAPHTASSLAVAAQLAATQGDRDTLSLVIDRWPALASRRSRIEHLIWKAVLAHVRGDESQSKALLESAVRLADIEGHVRVFLDAGPLVERLLVSTDALAGAGTLKPLARALEESARAGKAPEAQGLLSEREMAVLRELRTLLSNQEVAEKMMISQNTLKTHLRRIYRKLGVGSRREAVMRAEELGLLPRREA